MCHSRAIGSGSIDGLDSAVSTAAVRITLGACDRRRSIEPVPWSGNPFLAWNHRHDGGFDATIG